MDGLPETFPSVASPRFGNGLTSRGFHQQTTLKAAIGCVGTGLHTGRRVHLELRPAPAGTGIVFRRTDLGAEIPARFHHVTDTRLCTVLALPDQSGVRVGTVEHVMAALSGCGIDNAYIDVDGPEVPILDGSAAPFVFLLECAGTVAQDVARSAIEVRRAIRVEAAGAFAELRPGTSGTLDMALSIDFPAPAIGRQALSLSLAPDVFRGIAGARTFTLAEEIARLHEAGLARGGSLENAVVVDGARVLNPEGLRVPDEFVRHKLLDAVGDLALAGKPISGRFLGHCSGHTLNNRLLCALFADPQAWREVPLAAETRLSAAA